MPEKKKEEPKRKINFMVALDKCLDTSVKTGRPITSAIWYEDGLLYATNGKLLAIVPSNGLVPPYGLKRAHAFIYDKARRALIEVPVPGGVNIDNHISAFKRLRYLDDSAEKRSFYSLGEFDESIFYTEVVRKMKRGGTLDFNKFKLAFRFGDPVEWCSTGGLDPVHIFYDDPSVRFIIMPIRM